MKTKFMKLIIFVLLTCICMSFGLAYQPKHFPSFSAKNIEGKLIENNFFERKKTIVIVAHLGCPAAMQLLDDLNYIDTSKFQLLIFLENT